MRHLWPHQFEPSPPDVRLLVDPAKACVMTEHAPMPDEFRTMAACEALGTMLPVCKRYGSLLTLVMKELLRSIYEVLPMLV